MLSSNRVLVDTSAHFALADPHDENHQKAAAIETLAQKRGGKGKNQCF